jgi:hypothetical protein
MSSDILPGSKRRRDTSEERLPKRWPMAMLPKFNFEIQVIAAFVIFVFGYVALFGSLMAFLFLAKGLYESAKAVRAYALRC